MMIMQFIANVRWRPENHTLVICPGASFQRNECYQVITKHKNKNLVDKGYQVNIQWKEQGKSPVKLEIKMGNRDEWEVIRN